ncbi:MAG: FUSC family protein [Flavobacteriaceae bacterium]|nr:FUSC family protein [Flavobacteriaceae bacterium]
MHTKKQSPNVRARIKSLMQIKETERLWHFPVIAGLCVGVCLLIGWYFDMPNFGKLSSLGAMVILYLTPAPLANRMVQMAVCAFGLIFAFASGIVFSFHPLASAFSIFFVAFLANFVTSYFETPAPGRFFFIMLVAIASSMPFDVYKIPTNVGLVAMGALLAVILAFLYSVFIARNIRLPRQAKKSNRRGYTHVIESLIIGLFLGGSILIGHAFKLDTPYWITVSAAAIIQGRDFLHMRERNIQRITGTFVGIGLTWLIFLTQPNLLVIVLLITLLQFIVEMLVVRNYGIAAVFITPLTILLAEMDSPNLVDTTYLMSTRLIDTIIGSLIGLLAGLILHQQSIIQQLEKQFREAYFKWSGKI